MRDKNGTFFKFLKNLDIGFIVLFILSIILVAIMLIPTMKSGYMYDDSFDSLVKGKSIEMGMSLLQYTDKTIHSMMYVGHFFPLQLTYMWYLYYYIDNLTLYKIIKIVFIIFDIIAFSYLVKQLTGSKYLGVLSILIAPIFLQVRTFYDAILAFNLLLPLLTLFTLLSIILLIHYLNNKKIIYLIISIICYAVSLLTYEISYAFIPIHLAVIYLYTDKNLKKTARVFLPFTIILFSIVLFLIYIRLSLGVSMMGGNYNESYVPNTDLVDYSRTVINQLFASIPFSFYVTDPSTLITENIQEINNNIFFIITIMISVFILFMSIFTEAWSKKENRKDTFHLVLPVIIGILLWILPSVIISLSPRYQADVFFGVAYLPVYVSYFGIMLISLTLANWFISRYQFNKKTVVIIACIFAILVACAYAFTFSNTSIVVEKSNQYFKYPRDIVESAFDNGLFNYAPQGSILLIDNEYPWDQRAFYLSHNDNNFSYVGSGNVSRIYGGSSYILKDIPAEESTNNNSTTYRYEFLNTDNVYYLNYGSFSGDSGYAIFTKLRGVTVTDDRILNAKTDEVYLYLMDMQLSDNETRMALGLFNDSNINLSNMILISNLNDSGTISSGENWRILKINPEENSSFDIKSLFIYNPSRTLNNMDWETITNNHTIILDTTNIYGPYNRMSGWYDVENWNGVPTRWMENNAKVLIYSDEYRSVDFTMSVLSYNKSRNLNIYVNNELASQKRIGNNDFSSLNIPINLKKGLNIITLNTPEGSEYPRDSSGEIIEGSRLLSLAVNNIKITSNDP